MNGKIMTIGIVGYGLIGGSMGLALKKYTDNQIIAFDKNEGVLEYVRENGLAHRASSITPNAIKGCDVIFVALYPQAIISFMEENSQHFKKGAIVVDLCGIKEFVVSRYGKSRDKNYTFIGAHPMAGKEKNGIAVADADLYKGASFLLTPDIDTDTDALECVKYLAKKVGFEKIIVTTDKNHDKMITYTSQLPHVMSVAYIMQDAHKSCDGYYAGSFKDMTRVADINAKLWTQLFKNNGQTLVNQIDEYISALENIKKCILADDNSLEGLLEKSRQLKEWQDENYKY